MTAGASAGAVERVVDVVAELLACRAEQTAQEITIGQQYDSLRQPGAADSDEDLLAQILSLNLSVAELEQADGAVRGAGSQGPPPGRPGGSSPSTGSCDYYA